MAAPPRVSASVPSPPPDEETIGSPSSRTRSIWLLQLVLAASIVLTVLLVQALAPELFGRWTFSVGIGIVVIVTAVTLIVPWNRLSRNAVVALPLADLIGIGLLSFGSDLRFGFFWVFPVIWIATHFALGMLLGALGAIGGIILLDATVNGPTAETALRLLIVMISLTFIGLTSFLTARQTRAFKQLLRRQAARLQGTLARVSGQERRVSQMLNGLDTGIARLSSDGEVLAVNDAYVVLYAIERDDPKRPGRSVEYSSLRGDPLPEAERTFNRAARGEQLSDERVWLFDSHGQWRALSASTRELSAPGDPPSTLLIIHDVTAMIEAERARERLAATVSHELRNPLTAILGHADLALEEDVSPRVRDQLEVIENAGQRMQELIAGILQTARSQSREQQPATRIDLRRILDASVESFRPAALGRRVDVTLVAAPELPLVADAFRLRQVFDNILSNAIKYTPGGGAVVITAVPENHRMTVTIADTGVGIAPSELPHIFDAYFRTRSARDSTTPGTGLGMGIVREIVEQHGGTVSVESEQGTGTTVTIRLPIEPDN